MKILLFSSVGFVLFLACSYQEVSKELSKNEQIVVENPEGKTLQERFNTPEGFVRDSIDTNSFGVYLRNLPLKPAGSFVKIYDGRVKTKPNVYCAVVDLPIGKRDLHQCADAVMRLRAEYLWSQKKYSAIHFNFTNGFRANYSEWMKGKRISVNGNSVSWVQNKPASNTSADLWAYMEMVFNYAGTLSLSKELKTVAVKDMQIGDVFILGGSPGHTVIVVDKATNAKTGKQLFILAQSYMPAQEIQVLINPNDEANSPWYSLDFGELLETPEWDFKATQLMRFAD
jgi:hypothetical protein